LDCIDKKGRKCGTVVADEPISDLTGAKFVLVAVLNDQFQAIMVRWRDEVAERCAFAQLNMNVLDSCLPPGPRWKPVVLS
jgi:hypothetical protein